MLQMSRIAKWGLGSIVIGVLLFMYVPLLVVILNSFNTAQLSSWPIQEFSLRWWLFAVDYEPIRLALLNSVIVASAAMVIASILGTNCSPNCR
jgi:putative spermidine/putrescine transport system permease protein